MGRMPGVLLIHWMYGTAMGRNTAFFSEVEKQLDRKSVILPLGRSGKRSAGAAEILTVAGFENVFNVLDGFRRRSGWQQGREITSMRDVTGIFPDFWTECLDDHRFTVCFLSFVLLFSSLHE